MARHDDDADNAGHNGSCGGKCLQCDLKEEQDDRDLRSNNYFRSGKKPDVLPLTQSCSSGGLLAKYRMKSILRKSHSLSQFQLQNSSSPDVIAANSCA
jgi:hypothetical protein